MHGMQPAVKVRIEHGQVVVDGPVALPEGSRWKLVPLDSLDEEMSDAERGELHQAIREGFEDAKAGRTIPAEQWLAELRSRL